MIGSRICSWRGPRLRKYLNFVVALACVLTLATAARAQPAVSFPNLGDKVPGAGDATYLDLVRKVVPDIAVNGDGAYEGHKAIDVRHIGGDDMKSEPPEKISFFNAAVLPIQSDGKDRLLLLLDLDQAAEGPGIGNAVLALYSLGSSPALIDAADVSYDDDTYFFDPGFLSLGEGKNALLTMSTHFNAGESYVTSVLTLLRNDRLQLIDTVSTFHLLRCGYMMDEVPEFHAGNGDGRAYADLVATVTQTIEPNDTQCSGEHQPAPKAGTRTVTVTYRWDDAASKYVPDSDALQKLFEEDRDRL
jgi:hypothetical protein